MRVGRSRVIQIFNFVPNYYAVSYRNLTSSSKRTIHFRLLNLQRQISLHFHIHRKIMNLSSVVKCIEDIAPKHLAEKWDNTGLLIEPDGELKISTVFLTNDLTVGVLKEAVSKQSNLIISYHPPIFSAFKSLRQCNWKDHIVMECISRKIAVYSPHTACDAVRGGVNDWLIKCFDLINVMPIQQSIDAPSILLNCLVESDQHLKTLNSNLGFQILTESCSGDGYWAKILVNKQSEEVILQHLSKDPGVKSITVQECRRPKHDAITGMGRVGKLKNSMKLNDCIKTVKNHVKLDKIRIAFGDNHSLDTDVTSLAVCAGSGATLLKGVVADVYITGEMSHHELLDAQHKGTSVILCEHSNSERGYLQELANQLQSKLTDVKVIVSTVDKDPITIV